MIFVLDESSFDFESVSLEQCIEVFEEFLDLIDAAIEAGWEVFYSEDFFRNVVGWGLSFYDLYSDESPLAIPMEVRERVAAIFSVLLRWDADELPDFFDVTVDGQHSFAPSIAWTASRILSGVDASCFRFRSRGSSGLLNVCIGEKHTPIWFVVDLEGYRKAFRSAITCNSDDFARMELYSASAFPNLRFVDGVFSGIKDMSKPYLNVCAPIVCHLSAFSDFGVDIFLGNRADVSARFGALGVDISDENGNTRRDAEAMAQRCKQYEGESLYFTWHSKLERDRDRIHICPDKVQGSGPIIVGIFCRHLK